MVTKVEKRDFADYLGEAKSWETSKVEQLEQSVKKAWLVAVWSGVLATIAVITVAVLGPQKTAVPYVIRVDNVTGAVDIVTALKDGKTNYDEAMNKYHLQWYVRWREGYSKYLIGDFYKNVGIMSSPPIQNSYAAYMSKSNPSSPLVVYGEQATVGITIKSTSFIAPNIALIRFSKEVNTSSANNAIQTTHWAATVTFSYAGTPMRESDRAINPLGFQVLEYRIDPDQAVTENVSPTDIPTESVTPHSVSTHPAVPAIQ